VTLGEQTTTVPRRGRAGAASAPGPSDALVLDADLRQALVATRSLGRAGLKVGVVCGGNVEPGRWTAPTRSSRWASTSTDVANFEEDPDAYGKDVLALAAANPGCVVIPCSDHSLGSLQPFRAEIAECAFLAMASDKALTAAADKELTLQVASGLSIPVPRTVMVRDAADIAPALEQILLPVVVKPESSWVREIGGPRHLVREAVTRDEAFARINALLDIGIPALIQPWVGGARETVSLIRSNGKTIAAAAMVILRMAPVLGGASVVRESIPLDPALLAYAVDLVDAMGLEGFANVEFRRDLAGVPMLMEVNARLDGSIECPVRAGVDFPLLLWQWASGRPVDQVTGYRTGVRVRWLTGDLRWLSRNLRDPSKSDAVPAGQAIRTFLGSFADRQSYDYFDWRDPMPLVAEFGRMASKHVSASLHKVVDRRVTVPPPVTQVAR
jgi:predicted ATP-grasp superfamily ATP-dependent carboligase